MADVRAQEEMVLGLMEKIFCRGPRRSPPRLNPAACPDSRTHSRLKALVKAYWQQRRRRHKEAIDLLEPLVEPAPDAQQSEDRVHLQAVAELAIGVSALRTFKIVRAKQALGEMRALVGTLDIDRLRWCVHHLDGMIRLDQDDLDGAIDKLRAAAKGYDDLDDRLITQLLRAQVAADLAWALAEADRPDRAKQVINLASARMGAKGDPYIHVLLTRMKARIARRLSDYPHAIDLYSEALKAIGEMRPGDEPLKAITHDYLGDTLLLQVQKHSPQGQDREKLLDKVALHYEQFAKWAGGTDEVVFTSRADYSSAKLFCVQGEAGSAIKYAKRVESALRKQASPPHRLLGRTCMWLARIHRDLDNLGQCRRYLQKAKKLLRKHRSIWHLTRALVMEADLEAGEENLETAMDSLGEAQACDYRSDVGRLVAGIAAKLNNVPAAQWRRFIADLAERKRQNWQEAQRLSLWDNLMKHAFIPLPAGGGGMDRARLRWKELVESQLPLSESQTVDLRWCFLEVRLAVEGATWLVAPNPLRSFPLGEGEEDLAPVIRRAVDGMNRMLGRKEPDLIGFEPAGNGPLKAAANPCILEYLVRCLLVYSFDPSSAPPSTTPACVRLTADEDAITITIDVDAPYKPDDDDIDPFYYDPTCPDEERYSGNIGLLSCGHIMRLIGGDIHIARTGKLTFECRWPRAPRPQQEGRG